jgi:hypothetical protein
MRNLRPRRAGFKNCGRRLAGSKTCSIAVRLGVVRTARLGNAAPQPARVPASRSGHGSTRASSACPNVPGKQTSRGHPPRPTSDASVSWKGSRWQSGRVSTGGKQRLDGFHVSTPPFCLIVRCSAGSGAAVEGSGGFALGMMFGVSLVPCASRREITLLLVALRRWSTLTSEPSGGSAVVGQRGKSCIFCVNERRPVARWALGYDCGCRTLHRYRASCLHWRRRECLASDERCERH